MTSRGATRLATAGLLVVALVGLWQTLLLERWSFDGPGAGFFPQLVAGVCVLLALVVLVWPGKVTTAGDDGDTETPDGDAGTRRAMWVYSLAMVVLALGAMFAGFAVTAMAVTVLVMRGAEQRSWASAFSYGLVCALVGLVLFGWLLRVDLPEGPIERQFFTLVR